MSEKIQPSYIVGAEAWYADTAHPRTPYLMVGAYAPGGGCEWEFMIETVTLNGRQVPRVGVFDDAFAAFTEARDLFDALAAREEGQRPWEARWTLDEIREVLNRLGYPDCTARVSPVATAQEA